MKLLAPSFLARLACPNCHSDTPNLSQSPLALYCPTCGETFPVISCGEASIPWLFPNAKTARLEWSARYKGFLSLNAAEHNRLNRALAGSRLESSVRKRIVSTLHARKKHRNQITSILEPVGLDMDDLVPAVTTMLNDKLPKNHGLSSYANNAFRDWAWNNGENEALLEAVEEVFVAAKRTSIGSVLTLGAGACRLPYDIHRRFSPNLSVSLDFNPLLLLIGSRVIQGDSLPLYEFPIAPIDGGDSGILQSCCAPLRLQTGHNSEFRFVLGDATRPPFAPHSFDTVVTPWFIDIIPQDLRDFVPQINRVLEKGGVWVNTGSLAFFHDDPCRCYSEGEVLEIVEQNGFEILAVKHRTVPYLQSPHSAHGRVERIVSFAARKHADVAIPEPAPYLPDWALDTSLPIPSSPGQVVASSTYLLTAQVLAAIDGKRSIDAIGKLVAREYNLSMDECIHAIRCILVDSYENSSSVNYWGHS